MSRAKEDLGEWYEKQQKAKKNKGKPEDLTLYDIVLVDKDSKIEGSTVWKRIEAERAIRLVEKYSSSINARRVPTGAWSIGEIIK